MFDAFKCNVPRHKLHSNESIKENVFFFAKIDITTKIKNTY
jgi:hypothetical protein